MSVINQTSHNKRKAPSICENARGFFMLGFQDYEGRLLDPLRWPCFPPPLFGRLP